VFYDRPTRRQFTQLLIIRQDIIRLRGNSLSAADALFKFFGEDAVVRGLKHAEMIAGNMVDKNVCGIAAPAGVTGVVCSAVQLRRGQTRLLRDRGGPCSAAPPAR